ncbi:MAG: OmpA family protein [Treponema sp.]|nr:OmpA family protein [Treponema sp.]
MKKTILTILNAVLLLSAVPLFAERGPEFISPNNDGVQDELVIPLKIYEKRYVESWSLIIEDASGKIVRKIGNKVSLPENITFKSFFKQLITPKQGVDIPASVTWNGAMDNGETAPDGTYQYYFTATDDNGNVGKTDKYEVVVDTSAPQITVEQPSDRIFGEGAKSEFRIRQSGSKEDEWVGSFKAADGSVVRRFIWKNSEPLDFTWNGANDSGTPVADGVYSYEVKATDRAGNVSADASITNIIFSAEKPATNISIDGSKYFSPKSDSKLSSIILHITIPVPAAGSGNKLTSWSVAIVDAGGKVYRTYDSSSSEIPPDTIVFDGTDPDGSVLANGRYQAKVVAKYLNGFEPVPVFSPVFVLDTTKPDAQVRVSDKIFGAGSKSTITISQFFTPKTLAAVKAWNGRIYAADDESKVVKKFSLGEFPPDSVVWDGLDDNDKLAPNGSYVFELSATDLAGNTGVIRSDQFSLDTTEATIMLAMKDTSFSPNSDRSKDTIMFTPVTHAGSGGIVKYTFTILSAATKTAVKTISENRTVPSSFVWDGKDDTGIICPDGQYTASLDITSANDSAASATTQQFTLDTKAPYLSARIPWSSFSPDGDGNQDTIPVAVTDCTTEKLWSAEVKDAKGTVIRKFTWNGTVQTDGKPGFDWTGADESGNTASDGIYSIVISSTDEAGNTFSTSLNGITLDNREVKAYVTTDLEGISPNGDNALDSQKFTIRTTVPDGILSWIFDVCREDGTSIRSWSEKDSLNVPAAITWDGLDQSGKAGEGTFTGRLQIVYKKGNKVTASSAPFVCSATPPVLSVKTAPEYFSPDNDGTDDDLFVMLNGSTKGRITNWSFTINDPQGSVFWRTGGTTAITNRIVWDGLSNTQKDAGGMAERVQSAMDYPWTFTVKDSLGMSSTVNGIIAVDVLVIRDGNVLKMAVPSIIFRSDNADFKVETVPGKKDGVTAEQAEKNERVLKRIAEILNKFKDYKVTVVGHANRTTNDEAEETQDNPRRWGPALIPLSLKRAEFVKSYLVSKGVGESRLSTEGKGGTEPVADWQDKDNNWKNRRVEFILEK